MSMGIMPIAVMPIVSPKGDHQKSPFILDETLPKAKNPQEVINAQMKEKLINMAKNKPDSERNFMDYIILAQDKLSKMDAPVCYYA